MSLEDLRAQQARRRALVQLIVVGAALVLAVWLWSVTPSDVVIAGGGG